MRPIYFFWSSEPSSCWISLSLSLSLSWCMRVYSVYGDRGLSSECVSFYPKESTYSGFTFSFFLFLWNLFFFNRWIFFFFFMNYYRWIGPFTCSHFLLWSVWIEFILLKLKIENWKYCSKIIFKCVNSIVRPIFNKNITKKWNL